MKSVKCVRVYSNGSRVVLNLTAEEAEAEAEYNKRFRGGAAFFINGECRQTGYLSVQRCMDIVRELSS